MTNVNYFKPAINVETMVFVYNGPEILEGQQSIVDFDFWNEFQVTFSLCPFFYEQPIYEHHTEFSNLQKGQMQAH